MATIKKESSCAPVRLALWFFVGLFLGSVLSTAIYHDLDNKKRTEADAICAIARDDAKYYKIQYESLVKKKDFEHSLVNAIKDAVSECHDSKPTPTPCACGSPYCASTSCTTLTLEHQYVPFGR